ncbi:MAG: hypothetical protein AAGC65_01745 [Mucilaginibacter sp.]|uniref:hypothetical protein n=1 Tax=Mucilaginibacter sp. TaxID=1882438 RepID=UPI0031ACB7F8
MKTKFLILSFILFTVSCSSLDIFGYKNLGNHYFIWEGDHYKYSIIWTPDDSHAKVGGALVIGDVVKYDYNKTYIIAKTTEYKISNDSINKFWLINKSRFVDTSNKNWDGILTGPLDSLGLIEKMRQNKIELKLKDVSSH